MDALEQAISAAILSAGDMNQANKAYLEFIKANFIIPIKKHPSSNEPEVLFLTHQNQYLLPVFSAMNYFDQWASEISNEISLLKLTGVNLLKGVGDDTLICLNIGAPHYKEFNQSEIAKMKGIVLKIFSNSSSTSS